MFQSGLSIEHLVFPLPSFTTVRLDQVHRFIGRRTVHHLHPVKGSRNPSSRLQIDRVLHGPSFFRSHSALVPFSPSLSIHFLERKMSDEEHHFESKADAGASKTYPQQAGTIRKNGYLVIKGRPCKVVEVSTSKTGKHGHAKCHFVAIDIFTSKKLEDIVPSSHNCDVPHVNRTDFQLIDISEDGFVSLLTESGDTKDDLKLPTDDSLNNQLKAGFEEGKDLVLTVMSAMGEEQICAIKEIGPK